ncbi:multidrug effflux MFS transporter [Saxibacter everestensis]|uniref:Multidrug effflux MFS transporter n=1 Tax=Saxibacter everestensis TaxID=2909229 RepID=A0ABY8QUK2_9MICO|nr:multidrug effflux MFS transporter [Brevibacteriaceae bacterium ZFBP1038]
MTLPPRADKAPSTEADDNETPDVAITAATGEAQPAPEVRPTVEAQARAEAQPAHEVRPHGVARPSAGRLLLFGALTAIGPLTIDMYLAAFPAVTEDLGTTEAVVQLTLTATLAGLALGQLLLGSISDALGRRNPLIVALSIYVLASVVVALSDTIALLFAMRFLQGLTAAAGMVLSQAMVRDLYSGSILARLISRLMLIVGVAPVLAPTIGAQFLLFGTWRTMFFGLGLFGLALVVLALIFVKDTLPVERRVKGGIGAALRSYGVLIRSRRYIGLVLTGSVAMGALFTYISSATFIFQGLYGMSAQVYALLFAAGALMLTAGSQLNGFLVGRVHPARIMRVALIGGTGAGALLLASALLDLGVTGVVCGILLVLFSLGFVMPNNPVIALHEHGNRAGAAAAFLGASQFLVGSIIAPVSGLFGASSAVPMAAIMAACLLVATVVYHLMARPSEIVRDIPWGGEAEKVA